MTTQRSVGVLGPLLLPGSVHLGPIPTRVLLALVVAERRVVADGVLIDRVWPGGDGSVGALRNAVMRIRGALGADAVARAGPGYRLVADVATDLDRFRALVDEPGPGRRERLRAALALIRGDPFADVGDLPWGVAAARLWRDHQATTEDAWAAATGAEAPEQMAELVRLARDRPDRQARWVAVLAAARASGRVADGVRVYHEARVVLASFGLVPSPMLRDAADALLEGDEHDSLAIVGRDDLVAEIQARLGGGPLTLTGPAGVGKTCVAREVARAQEESGRAVTWIDLAGVADRDELDEAIRRGSGTASGSEQAQPAAALRGGAGPVGSLVVFDGADAVGGEIGPIAATLTAAGLDVVVTSRHPLGTRGEGAISVGPLEIPDADADGAATSAVRMLALRAGRSLPPHALGRVARAVGGLPLALELIAPVLRRLPAEDVADSLERAEGFDDGPLATVFDVALDQLDDAGRDRFERLGAVPGPFTLATATALADDAGGGPASTIAGLERLHRAALIEVTPTSAAPYSMTALQRATARRRSGRRWPKHQARVRTWYASMVAAEGARTRTADQSSALQRLHGEAATIARVVRDHLDRGEVTTALDMVGWLGDYWLSGQDQTVGRQLVGECLDALAAGGAVDPAARRAEARARLASVHAAGSLAGIAAAESSARRALELAVEAGDQWLAEECETYVAIAEAWRGELPTAIERFRRLVDAANPWAATQARLSSGLGEALLGRPEPGVRRMEAIVRERQHAGDRLTAALALMQLGVAVQRHGSAKVAVELLERAQEIAGSFPMVMAHCTYALDELGDRRGGDLLDGVVEYFRHAGDIGCWNGVQRARADIARRAGADDVALTLLRETVWLVPAVDQQEAAAAFVQIGEIYADRGLDEAATVLARAADQLRSGRGIGWSDAQRARLDDLRARVGSSSAQVEVQDAVERALTP